MMPDVLLHAEDPGAANLLAPLPASLCEVGLTSRLFASGPGIAYLDERGIEHGGATCEPGQLLDATQPGALVVGTCENRDSYGLGLIDAARERAIPSMGAVDMLANAAYRFRGHSDDPLHHAPDWVAVPDAATAHASCTLGFERDRVVPCGHPQFDVVRTRAQALSRGDRAALRAELLPDLDPDRPLFVFLAEGIDQFDPEASRVAPDLLLRGSGTSRDRTTVVLEEVLVAASVLASAPQIVLRLHPKNDPDAYGALIGSVAHVSHGGDPLPLVWCADLVVGMTTFLLVEAHLLGRPTLSVLPDPSEAAWLPTTADGITPVVSTPGDLASFLSSFPGRQPPPAKDDLLPTGAASRYAALVRSMVG